MDHRTLWDKLDGAALVLAMRLRPEGLWPKATHRREFHEVQEEEQMAATETAARKAGKAD